MPTTHEPSKKSGFTLVEIMVAIPVAILAVVVLVAFMIMLVGSVYTAKERVGTVYSIQTALDRIEQDVRLGSSFLTTTGTLPPYQGSDATATAPGTGAPFTPSSSSSTLVIQQYASTGSPYDSTRKIVYYQYPTPSACGTATETLNTPVQVMIIYYLSSGTVYRRTITPQTDIAPKAPYALCSKPWQLNSCLVDFNRQAVIDTSKVCRTKDDVIASNVSSLSFTYYPDPGSTSAMAVSAIPGPRTVVASMSMQATVAGNTIPYSGTMRATLVNE